MKEEQELYLHKKLDTDQGKYTYFLLAIAASAIAFAVQITKESIFELSLIPLGISVLSWGLSFYCGCQNMRYSNANTIANIDLFRVRDGLDPDVGDNVALKRVAIDETLLAYDSNSKIICSYNNWQFRLLILGAISFIFWRLLEMAIRTSIG